MPEVGLAINISANVVDAVRALGGLNDNLVELATEGVGSIESVNLALQDLRTAAKNAGNTAELGMFNRAIRDLSVEARNLKNVGLEQSLGNISSAGNAAGGGIGILGLNLRQARVGFTDFARLASGSAFSIRNLTSTFALFGPVGLVAGAVIYGIYEYLNQMTDAEKKAAEQAKQLQEELINIKTGTEVSTGATGSTAGEVARVQILAAAMRDTNLTYSERNRALQELIQTNKSYFGDLTLEADSLQALAGKVKAYTDALVTEAIIKDQSEAIAKMSEQLLTQVHILDQLRDAKDRADLDVKRTAGTGGAGIDAELGTSDSGQDKQLAAQQAATDAFRKQQDVVLTLRTAITEYNSELNKNVGIQLQQKPLQVPPEADKGISTLLDKIIAVKKELSAPVESPLFRQLAAANDAHVGGDIFKQYQQKIADAIAEGAKIGTARAKGEAAELVGLYNQELKKIQFPNLTDHVQGIVAVKPIDVDVIGSAIEKALGTKEIKVHVPIDIVDSIKAEGFDSANTKLLLQKAAEDALNNIPAIRWNAKIQILLDQKTLQADFQKQLSETFQKLAQDVVASGLTDVGKSIGDAISKGKSPLEAAGDAILSTIGSLMESVGQALIKYGAQMILVKAVLAAGLDISPAVAIVAGVALVAAGELVKKSFKATAFAEGGIITGPTYALMGEAGPEAVFPLSKINDFINNIPGQGGPTQVNVSGTIRGQDLLLIQQRAQKNYNNAGKQSTL